MDTVGSAASTNKQAAVLGHYAVHDLAEHVRGAVSTINKDSECLSWLLNKDSLISDAVLRGLNVADLAKAAASLQDHGNAARILFMIGQFARKFIPDVMTLS